MIKKVVLLGPQQPAPDAGAALAELGVTGRVALVRAGYQEREDDDKDTIAALGVPATNLALHARGVEVFREDTEFTTAYHARQQRLRHMQSFYRTRLEKEEEAAKTISLRYVDPDLLAQEEKVSVDQLRHLDADHVERCAAVRKQFDDHWVPSERRVIARHRQQVRAVVEMSEAIVIAGGHVASLLNRLELFGVLEPSVLGDRPIVAWGAGAMVLTDRIVLFHDFPPYGSDIAQVLDAGFGLAPGYVVLPDPRRRVNYTARAGIQRFARRMAPSTCVALDAGARMVFEAGALVAARGARLTTAGDVEQDWDGAPSRFSTPYLHGVHV